MPYAEGSHGIGCGCFPERSIGFSGYEHCPAGQPIQYVFSFDAVVGGLHAIDYLTYYSNINDPSHMSQFGHAPEIVEPVPGETEDETVDNISIFGGDITRPV